MCDPILVTLWKMQPHYGHSSRENATPSSGTSPLACYKEVPHPFPPRDDYDEKCSVLDPVFKFLRRTQTNEVSRFELNEFLNNFTLDRFTHIWQTERPETIGRSILSDDFAAVES